MCAQSDVSCYALQYLNTKSNGRGVCLSNGIADKCLLHSLFLARTAFPICLKISLCKLCILPLIVIHKIFVHGAKCTDNVQDELFKETKVCVVRGDKIHFFISVNVRESYSSYFVIVLKEWPGSLTSGMI